MNAEEEICDVNYCTLFLFMFRNYPLSLLLLHLYYCLSVLRDKMQNIFPEELPI